MEERKVSHPGIEIPFGWFTSEQHPFVDPETAGELDGELSDYVLIDLDGNRKDYAVGCYHFPYEKEEGGMTEGWWSVGEHYQSALDESEMRWSYLPLAHYEKE